MKLYKLLSVLFLVMVFFAFAPEHAFAEDLYFFRIESELNVLIPTGSGPTIKWKCNGTGEGIVTDNTASESTQALDGIIKVASTSAENASNRAGCDAGESITATASIDGWLTKKYTGTVSAVGANVTFTSGASLQYTIVVNGITDELSTALTLNGTIASATYSGTVASQSYSGGKRYIAGSTSGGTVKGGADGYVNRTSSALTVSSTASQSVDFGTTDDSSLDESGLNFGHKISVTYADNRPSSAVSGTNVVAGIVTSGDSLGTSCTIGTGDNAGKWYCPVPLAHTETTASFRHDDLVTATATYTDRSSGADAQTLATISTSKKSSGGGGGSSTPFVVTTPTPAPTPALMPRPSQTPVPEPSPSATPVLTPIPAPTPVSATLFRKARDPKVYIQGSDGTLRWIKTAVEFVAAGYNWTDVKEISGSEFAKLKIGGKVRVVKNIRYLNVRSRPSLGGKILGKVMSNEEFEFADAKNGWYQIKKNSAQFGWVFGGYVQEF